MYLQRLGLACLALALSLQTDMIPHVLASSSDCCERIHGSGSISMLALIQCMLVQPALYKQISSRDGKL